MTSGIMRFSGLATDSMGDGNVATVQVSVNQGPFVDATLHGDGTWSTAAYVGTNPFHKTFAVTVKIIDKAGRVTTAPNPSWWTSIRRPATIRTKSRRPLHRRGPPPWRPALRRLPRQRGPSRRHGLLP